MISEAALLYDAHHARHTEDLAFWLGLAAAQGGPILELGCGSGRVLLPLARAGYAVFGLDLDFDVLESLKSRIASSPADRASIFQGDMAAFCLGARFPLITMPCNTLSTLSTKVLQNTLGNVQRHLAPGGLFAASLPNPVLFEQLPEVGEAEVEEIFTHPRSGNPVQASSSWDRSAQCFAMSWHYDHLLPDGTVHRSTVRARHNLSKVEDYTQSLRSAGLFLEALYGDFNRGPYRPDSEHLILIAGNM
jgi:SAM-dependent methyltransferase